MALVEFGRLSKLFLPENQPAQIKSNQPEPNINHAVSLKQDSINLPIKAKNNDDNVFARPAAIVKSAPPANTSFVKTVGGNFSIDGKPFKFIGTNMYSLGN